MHLPAEVTLLAQAVVRILPSCTLHFCGPPLDPVPWPTVGPRLAPTPVFVAQSATLPLCHGTRAALGACATTGCAFGQTAHPRSVPSVRVLEQSFTAVAVWQS